MTFKKMIGVTAAVAAVSLSGLALSSSAAQASSEPKSPDGIYSWQLCGTRTFDVNDGTYGHHFVPDGSPTYGSIGVQYYWSEYVWWGVFQVGGYTFYTTC